MVNDMTDRDWAENREVFLEAAATFADLVQDLQDQQDVLTKIALGEWTVQDLIGHTGRAVTTAGAYLKDEAPDGYDLDSAVAYYRFVGENTDHAAVAERGRQAGQALGGRPAEDIRSALKRVETALMTAQAGSLAETPAGRMRIADYLPTRTCELVVHSLDLIRATGTSIRVPNRALRQTTDLLFLLSHQLELDESVVAFLAGRDAPRIWLFGGQPDGG